MYIYVLEISYFSININIIYKKLKSLELYFCLESCVFLLNRLVVRIIL